MVASFDNHIITIAGAAEKLLAKIEILPSTKELEQTATRSTSAMRIPPLPVPLPSKGSKLHTAVTDSLRPTQTLCMNVLHMAVIIIANPSKIRVVTRITTSMPRQAPRIKGWYR